MASCRQDHLPRQTRVDQTRFRCPIRERGTCHALGVYRGIEFYAVVASTKRRRKVRFLESHLSESPQSSVPYFCYLLALCRSGSKALAMRMMASKRRSSFGINCVQCDIELIAPERSEYRDKRQIRHLWRCPTCDCSFESFVSFPADHKSMEDIMRRIEDVINIIRQRDAFSSRWSLGQLKGGDQSNPLSRRYAARFNLRGVACFLAPPIAMPPTSYRRPGRRA